MNPKYKVAIRADAGSEIGWGHVMRCLSLAEAFRRAGCPVCFISRNPEGIGKIAEMGFDVFRLNSEKSCVANSSFLENEELLTTEMEGIAKWLQESAVGILCIDTYRVSERYLLYLKGKVDVLAYIDDVPRFTYPVDVLINGNITGKYLDYGKYSPDELHLLGPDYNMIRGEFKGLPARKLNERIRSILITTGGTDPFQLCCRIAGMLGENRVRMGLSAIHIVVGRSFKDTAALESLSQKYPIILLHENVPKMSELMLEADLVICSGGSTLYEVCACGTPTLAFIMADNQEFIVCKMAELGYIQSLGWHDQMQLTELPDRIMELQSSYEYRKSTGMKMQCLIDGHGCSRIVEKLLERAGFQKEESRIYE